MKDFRTYKPVTPGRRNRVDAVKETTEEKPVGRLTRSLKK